MYSRNDCEDFCLLMLIQYNIKKSITRTGRVPRIVYRNKTIYLSNFSMRINKHIEVYCTTKVSGSTTIISLRSSRLIRPGFQMLLMKT